METKQLITTVTLAIVISVTVVLGYNGYNSRTTNVGSVSVGSEYYSTTTRPTLTPAIQVAKNGPGAVGNVTITGAAAGAIRLYNATTTNINLRTSQKATSSILIADFPNSTVAGTYVVDAAFSDGLIIDILGTIPTTTVTWR